MLDIKFIRENPDAVRENIKKKFQDAKLPLVDEVLDLDSKRRAAIAEADQLRSNRNTLSKQIGMLMGQAKKDPAKLAEAHRENQALLALYTIQQQYSAGDLAGCQASIDAFEASEYRDALPETAEEGVTPPSQRYAQLKEAAEAR